MNFPEGKTAVVLLNLGGPDSREAIRPFLLNFFTDPNIIRLPWPLRRILAEFISRRRSRKEALDSYARLGFVSPLLENTRVQAEALQAVLDRQARAGSEARVFISMRYWHPMTAQTIREILEYGPDRVVLLPLYPQFSTTTTGSSFEQWRIRAARLGLEAPVRHVCCYPLGSGFVAASAANIRAAYETACRETAGAGLKPPRVLFSAHGLPESIIRGGDPYQFQCEAGAAAMARATGIADLDWSICYQSRVGPMKWIGPGTEEALEQAARDGVPVLVYPHAFVSEHVETLVEIEEEYRELAGSLGIPYFARVETVGTQPDFIEGLAGLALQAACAPDIIAGGAQGITRTPLCPQGCGECYMRKYGKKEAA